MFMKRKCCTKIENEFHPLYNSHSFYTYGKDESLNWTRKFIPFFNKQMQSFVHWFNGMPNKIIRTVSLLKELQFPFMRKNGATLKQTAPQSHRIIMCYIASIHLCYNRRLPPSQFSVVIIHLQSSKLLHLIAHYTVEYRKGMYTKCWQLTNITILVTQDSAAAVHSR